MNTLGLLQSKWSQRASLTSQETRVIMIPWTFQKLNLLLIFTCYYKLLIYEIIYKLGDKTILYFKYLIVLTVLLECKTEKRTSQCEHGQPMEQTWSLFCMSNSGVARRQSQHQCHIWRMNWIFEVNCTGKWAWQLSIKFCVVHEAMNGCKILKIH